MKYLTLLFLSISAITFAQKVENYTVKTSENEKERKMILDLARQEVDKDIHQSVIFTVKHLKVSQNYAWLEADAKSKDGKQIVFEDDFHDCCHVEGLFEKKNGLWQVVQFGSFSTDCWYCGLSANYPQVPKEIFSEAAAMEVDEIN
ncbi:MAG: hypothetical protein V4638_00865 [Bacteroidota bacterium]